MLARLVDRFYLTGDRATFAEIRLNESLVGATSTDRQRLRWEITPTTPEPSKLERLRAEQRQQDRYDRGVR